jgi:hypothetical protein
MIERLVGCYQRPCQIGFDGNETNIDEKSGTAGFPPGLTGLGPALDLSGQTAHALAGFKRGLLPGLIMPLPDRMRARLV